MIVPLRLRQRVWLLAIAVLASTAVAAHAQTFGLSVPLNGNADVDSGIDEYPQVATDGTTWIAVWESDDDLGDTLGDDFDILTARSTDGGVTWSAPVALNSNAGSDTDDDTHPQITTDGHGTWIAVWETFDPTEWLDDYDLLVARSVDGGATWSAPAPLNSNAAVDFGYDSFVQVTTDGNGIWVAAWWSTDSLGGTIGSDGDILFARSLDGGLSWSAPAALNTNAATDGGSDQVPQITTDGAGTWVAVWQSYDTLAGTTGFDVDILTARSTDGGTTWSAPAPLNSNATTDSGDDFFAQVTTDGSTWVAVWFSTDTLFGTTGTDVDILTARSTDGGVTWSTVKALNTNADDDEGDDYSPQVTTDGAGTWITTWTTHDDLDDTIGTDTDIVVARSVDGGATWSDPEPLNAQAASDTGNDGNPQLITDGAGTWLAVWESNEPFGYALGDDYDILYAHTGTTGPTPTPVPTATASPTPIATPGPGEFGCAATPANGCRKPSQPARSMLALKASASSGSGTSSWTWTKGTTTTLDDFGDPTATTDYALCLYDETSGSAHLASANVIAGGGTCDGKPCWKRTASAFKYKNGGVALSLKAGLANNAKITFRAKQPVGQMPALPFAQSDTVTVQLLGSHGICWDADFSQPAIVNQPLRFKDKSD